MQRSPPVGTSMLEKISAGIATFCSAQPWRTKFVRNPGHPPAWKETVKALPFFRQILERQYEKQFAAAGAVGGFRGVYNSFAEARESAPKSRSVGFDNLGYAMEFADRRARIFSFDYPMLFWLQKLLTESSHIFDYGGHVGTHFYAYSKYLSYPEGMTWTVCDLPTIVQVGENLARTNDAQGLLFTTSFANARKADILIAAGSLQYVEDSPIASLLCDLSPRPSHLLLNKLPLYEGPQFVTLQSGGPAFHPQYVFNRRDFVRRLEAIGYSLQDSWTVETHRGYIPFHPANSFPYHSGLYLRRT